MQGLYVCKVPTHTVPFQEEEQFNLRGKVHVDLKLVIKEEAFHSHPN
jgi:hypothetical protein